MYGWSKAFEALLMVCGANVLHYCSFVSCLAEMTLLNVRARVNSNW